MGLHKVTDNSLVREFRQGLSDSGSNIVGWNGLKLFVEIRFQKIPYGMECTLLYFRCMRIRSDVDGVIEIPPIETFA
ncbi:hypothetical protein D3D02_15960 [Halobellus sp. Atlit-38R]|nr:hypothetical protein D3D02_15960 [Halobellus sp. Atlit-38R]